MQDEEFVRFAKQICGTVGVGEKHQHAVYLIAKEIAKTQRHRCADSVMTVRRLDLDPEDPENKEDLAYAAGFDQARDRIFAVVMNV